MNGSPETAHRIPRWSFHLTFAWGLAFGVAWWDGSLWIQFGPGQIEIHREPIPATGNFYGGWWSPYE